MLELKIEPSNVGRVLAALGLWEIMSRQRQGEVAFRDDTVTFVDHDLVDLEEAVQKLASTKVSGGGGKDEPTVLEDLGVVIDWYMRTYTGATPVNPKKNEPAQRRNKPVWKAAWSGRQRAAQMIATNQKLLETVKVDSNLIMARLESPTSKPKFGFDVTAGWVPLEVGWSPNRQDMNEYISPATELLSFIGAQTFVPSRSARGFGFSLWDRPLPISVARGVFGNGSVLSSDRYLVSQVQRSRDYYTCTRATKVAL